MTTYELWQGAMYCVGVFVTCNAGGLALWAFAGRLTRKKVRVVSVKGLSDALSASLAAEADADAAPKRKQSFAEMMRQVDAHKADYPPDEAEEEDGGPAPESERVTPEELAEAYRRTAPAPDAPSETDAA